MRLKRIYLPVLKLLSVVKFTEIYIPEKNNKESIIYWLSIQKIVFLSLKKGLGSYIFKLKY